MSFQIFITCLKLLVQIKSTVEYIHINVVLTSLVYCYNPVILFQNANLTKTDALISFSFYYCYLHIVINDDEK